MLNQGTNAEADDQEDDIISQAIGEYGRWQLTLTFLLSLVNIPCTWHIFVPNFQAAERVSWCARPPQFSNVTPEIWRNYTQPAGICGIFNISYFNNTKPEDLYGIQNIPGIHLVNCDRWEFEGEGKNLVRLAHFCIVCWLIKKAS